MHTYQKMLHEFHSIDKLDESLQADYTQGHLATDTSLRIRVAGENGNGGAGEKTSSGSPPPLERTWGTSDPWSVETNVGRNWQE